MKKKKNLTIVNTFASFLLQMLTLINGFIIPKLILSYFGSEVNGLVSSLAKFLSYVNLLEGGITGVVMASLYKPLVERNKEKISSIVKTTTKFYRKIAYIFIIYTIILASFYPIIFKSNFSYSYIFLLTIILSITSLVQYSFSLTMRTLLNADKKVYIVSFTQSIILIINIILSYISLKIYPSIHLFKLISAVLFLIQPLVFNYYVRKNYSLDDKVKEDSTLLKSRWDGFSINIAAFIHNNTDILILSIFTNFATVSVYSVYALVGTGLRTILNFLSNGIRPTIGQLYAKGNVNELSKKLDLYEFLTFFLVFLLFSVTCLLICPFVMIYTKNITDANYYQPVFGILLMLAEGVYLIKNAHVDLAYAANKFKEIKIHCYIEACINIVLSIALIKPFGLVGIAIGTLTAMIYRMIFHVWYTNKSLIKRPQLIFYKKMLSFGFFTIVGVLICILFIPKVEYNFINLIWHAIIYTFIFGILYLLNSLMFFKDEIKNIKKCINL